MKTINFEKYNFSAVPDNQELGNTYNIYHNETEVAKLYMINKRAVENLILIAENHNKLVINGNMLRYISFIITDASITYEFADGLEDVRLSAAGQKAVTPKIIVRGNVRLNIGYTFGGYEISIHDNAILIFEGTSNKAEILMYDDSVLLVGAYELSVGNPMLNVLAYDNSSIIISELADKQLKVRMKASLYDTASVIASSNITFVELNLHDTSEHIVNSDWRDNNYD